MRRPQWCAVVALPAAVLATLAVAATASAGPVPGLTGAPAALPTLPTLTPLPSPTLPGLPSPSLTGPGVPPPGSIVPSPLPPPTTGSTGGGSTGGGAPAPAPGRPGGGAGAPAAVTPENALALIAADPSADLYPQPPVDAIGSPQARLVADLGAVEHRLQYLHNILARTRADLATAEQRSGPVAQLIILLTAPAAPAAQPAGGAADTPGGRILALSSAVASGDAELARRQAQARALQGRINARVRPVIGRGGPVPVASAAYTGGRLRRPAAGPVTSVFGTRFDPYYHVWQLHAGLDIGAPAGAPIVAAAGGRVTQAGWFGGYGMYTCVDHGRVDGQRLSTCYGHQSRLLVAPGQAVRAGQVIGQVGATGAATGPHLHFEVRLGGRPTDPAPWI